MGCMTAWLLWLSFCAIAMPSPWWIVWSLKMGGKHADCSKVASLVIDVLGQPGWNGDGPMEHQTGLKVYDDGRVYLPNGASAGLNAYWKDRVKKAFAERSSEITAAKRAVGEISFAENVMTFSEKVRALR